MRKLIAIAALGIALTGFAAAPAAAQAVGQDAVVAACSGPNATADDCNAAVALFVASVRSLPAAQKDAQLAALVVALANSGSPATQAIVADAIQTFAVEFTDTTRAAAAIQIAEAVSIGADLDTVSVQTLSSPN